MYRGHIRIMEQKMETTIVYIGMQKDNEKRNGSYYLGFRV